MSALLPVQELVTPTGQYRHLRSPWAQSGSLSPACSARGTYRMLGWRAPDGWERDPRPLCPSCLERMRRWAEWYHAEAMEQLAAVEANTLFDPR